jgi:hypothetical protein
MKAKRDTNSYSYSNLHKLHINNRTMQQYKDKDINMDIDNKSVINNSN